MELGLWLKQHQLMIAWGANVLSFAAGIFMTWWLSRPGRDKARFEIGQMRLAAETESVAQLIIWSTDSWKERLGTKDLTFSEEELREGLRETQGLRLKAALDLLYERGRAKKVDPPGHWTFD